MNNSVFGKTTENKRKYRDTKLVTKDKRRNQLVSEPNYYRKNVFQRICQKQYPVFVSQCIYEVWFNYIQPKYQENAKLCYIDTDSFIIYIKSEDVYEDIADNVEKRFDTSDYKVNRPLSTGKNEKSYSINEG